MGLSIALKGLNVDGIIQTARYLAGSLNHQYPSSGYLLLARIEPGLTREEAALLLFPIFSPIRESELARSIWKTEGMLLFDTAGDDTVLTNRENAGGLRTGKFILVVKGFEQQDENEAFVLLLAAKYGFLSWEKAEAMAKERENWVFKRLLDLVK